jgi:hypothetical protein
MSGLGSFGASAVRSVLVALVAGAATDVGAVVECIATSHTHRTSRLSGQVFDPEGMVVPGAHVEVLRGEARTLETETDERGFFEVEGLTGFRGSIRVSLPGFRSETSEVVVDAGAPSRLLAVRLALGCGGEVCSVAAPAATALSKAPRCLFEPAWAAGRRKLEAQVERAGARCGEGDRGACRTLARIAERDKDSGNRELAASALSSQGLLLALVARAKDPRVCAVAVGKIDDQRVVAEHALGHSDEGVRAAATANLADGGLLARIAVSDTSQSVRAAAVRNPRLADQALLTAIAQGRDTEYVRQAAVTRLADPALLRTLTSSDAHQWIRTAALANPALDDQELFAALARSDRDPNVRKAAFGRVTDPALRQQASLYVDAEAVRQASDSERLLDVARKAGDPAVRAAAAAQITDAATLAAILEQDEDDAVRMNAALNPALTDQNALAKAAQLDPSLGVKVHAASRLADEALAQRVYAEVVSSRGWGRWHYAIEAARRITDQALLASIATSDEYGDVRREATRQLEDQAVLARLAVAAGSPLQQIDAIAKLSDSDLLRRIAATDPDWFVRKAAREALARREMR